MSCKNDSNALFPLLFAIRTINTFFKKIMCFPGSKCLCLENGGFLALPYFPDQTMNVLRPPPYTAVVKRRGVFIILL